jgi:hypothetical protein
MLFANRFDDIGGYIERTHDPRTYFMTRYNKRNDYGRDLQVQEKLMFCGIPVRREPSGPGDDRADVQRAGRGDL